LSHGHRKSSHNPQSTRLEHVLSEGKKKRKINYKFKFETLEVSRSEFTSIFGRKSCSLKSFVSFDLRKLYYDVFGERSLLREFVKPFLAFNEQNIRENLVLQAFRIISQSMAFTHHKKAKSPMMSSNLGKINVLKFLEYKI